MASFGNGYGSECHLLRYLGRHRGRLDEAVTRETGATEVRWLDFPFAGAWPDPNGAGRWPDVEWLSLDFLPGESEVVKDWKQRWPHGRGVMNWDAVGQVLVDGEWEWLLVEAKAHLAEIGSSCTATSPRSIELIDSTLSDTKIAVGASADADWMNGYYQYANRLAVLDHLTRNGVKSRLLFIYFTGDVRPDSFVCPQTEEGWSEALNAQRRHLRLSEVHPLSARIHKLFLPVWAS